MPAGPTIVEAAKGFLPITERPHVAWMLTFVLLTLDLFVRLARAQPESRVQFNLARLTCEARADSGSLAEALRKVQGISSDYPGWQELRESCQAAYNQLRGQEFETFAKSVEAFDSGSFNEARVGFQWLSIRNSEKAAEAKKYLALITDRAGTKLPTGPADLQKLQVARDYFHANDLGRAESIARGLVGGQGPAVGGAQELITQINVRRNSQKQVQRALQHLGRKEGEDALRILADVKKTDPGYSGLGGLLSQAERLAGRRADSPPPGEAGLNDLLAEAEQLIGDKRLGEALTMLRSAQFSYSSSPEITQLITRVETSLGNQRKRSLLTAALNKTRERLQSNDLAGAEVQLRQARILDERNSEVRALGDELSKRKTSVYSNTAKQEELDQILAAGLRAYYSGELDEAERSLADYLSRNGPQRAAALYFRGVIAYTQYSLGGARDGESEDRARRLFIESHSADALFRPVPNALSPKITSFQVQAVSTLK